MLLFLHDPLYRSIVRACNNLGPLDQRVSNAVKTRQEVDLRIGKEREREKGGRERMRERERERLNLSHASFRLCLHTVPD
jgi:hypothetical protein